MNTLIFSINVIVGSKNQEERQIAYYMIIYVKCKCPAVKRLE